MQSDTYTDGMRLVDAALQRDHETNLVDWLRQRRDQGDSYERISHELINLVGMEGYSVSNVTVMRWCIRLGLVEEPTP